MEPTQTFAETFVIKNWKIPVCHILKYKLFVVLLHRYVFLLYLIISNLNNSNQALYWKRLQ